MVLKLYYTSAGAQVEIDDKPIGVGGEGWVGAVPAHRGMVAKIYHPNRLPNAAKQAKLNFMATHANKELSEVSAWPTATLCERRGGPIVGFLMPNFGNLTPLHKLYNPRDRMAARPGAKWSFLLRVALSTAGAFYGMHKNAHVIGDVNEGNALAWNNQKALYDDKVVLIDADSFQIKVNGVWHLCEVGVGNFTPPELQGKSFSNITRTQNHDNFGLAILIFHLLFCGRHPYAGVTLRAGIGELLEEKIKEFRYAYARDARSRGIAPPKGTIPVSMLPSNMVAMFERAFTEDGVKCRPTALEWYHALKDLCDGLKECDVWRSHVYPKGAAECPWCALERQGVLMFPPNTTEQPTSPDVGVDEIWAKIKAVPVPPSADFPDWQRISVTPTPCPRVGVATVRRRRELALKDAQKHYDGLKAQWDQTASRRRFLDIREAADKLHGKYVELMQQEQREINALSTDSRAQLEKFLRAFSLDDAVNKEYLKGSYGTSTGSLRATLYSHGVTTAADVSEDKIRAIRGFGPVRTKRLMVWREKCAEGFRQSQAPTVSQKDVDEIRAKYLSYKAGIENQLRTYFSAVTRCRQEIMLARDALTPKGVDAAKALAQAVADWNVVKNF